MDWHNRLDVIREKVKFQLTSRGIDTMGALERSFQVGSSCQRIGPGPGQVRQAGQGRV